MALVLVLSALQLWVSSALVLPLLELSVLLRCGLEKWLPPELVGDVGIQDVARFLLASLGVAVMGIIGLGAANVGAVWA